MARIIVSAGHTNDQPGTVVNGIREVDLTRKIAAEVTKELRANDIITLSVPPNLDLARRIAWINQTGYREEDGDLAVEIHINEGGKSGVEGWHQADKTNSIELTKSIAGEIKTALGWETQGIKSEYDHELGSLAFLHNTNPIASLVECGYIDNAEDMKILQSDDGVKKLGKAIAQGILKYLGKTSTTPKSETQQDISNNTQSTAPANPAPIQTLPTNNIPTTDQFASNPNQSSSTPPLGGSYQPPSSMPPSGMSSGTGGGFANPSMGGGANFGGGGGGNNFGSGASRPGVGGTGGGGYMNREERKDMIKNNYIKILGREPSQSDLNYFLNLGTNEDQLIKRMVDSQEHADLVKSRQEVIKTKETLAKQTSDILYLRTRVADQQGIIKNLNQLLIQKNRAIYRLNLALRGYRQREPEQKPVKKVKYKRSTSERFLDFFSDKLGS